MARKYKKRKITSRRRRRSSGAKRFRLITWKGVITLGIFVALLAGGYLAQISSVSSKGYQIRVLENEIADLKEEQESLELQLAIDQSLKVVETKVAEMGMVPAETLEYLTIAVPVVAKR